MTKTMTCIMCPVGCQLTVEVTDKTVTSVEGNACKRGHSYAVDECTAPTRMLTTTVATILEGRRWMVPVKTRTVIPKELLFAAMKEINAVTLNRAVDVGDVVLAEVAGTGVDVVATSNIPRTTEN